MPTELTWRALTADDLAGTAALAGRCLAADGGLPLAATEGFLAGRFTGDGVRARGAADPAGRLVAAGAVRGRENADGTPGAAFLGLVDPAYRGRGVGAELVDWGLAAAAGIAERVVVESESLTEAARALFAARGLRQTFAEDVQRFDLRAEPPAIGLPDGVSLASWSPERAERFFEVYQAAFRHRPGFPGWSARRWIDWTADDEEFRPGWSLLATDASAGDVGFVTCAEGWIVQVGVRPEHRGRRLGAALVAEALRRMRHESRQYALLTVNVDNSAGALYQRLGFRTIGRRARFEPAPGAPTSGGAPA
ncbi:GNAT family N-acetyltransferase [Micromonospora sp. NPDC049559]|uniref:GNAT family N-acetyltransferase n=1 Tax=Micromonospora sp. NPDC049559 TaxID=3155923 RepID=UPI00341B247F